MRNKKVLATISAILAAVFFAIHTPFAKSLLGEIAPTYLAALLYLGAGFGIGAVYLVSRTRPGNKTEGLSRKDLPFTIGMIALDIAAPILLMAGLSDTAASGAALLSNFEIVATCLLALVFFREKISLRLWIGIVLITLASALLSVQNISSLQFSPGSVLIVAAALCWGLENNLTRRISSKNTLQIVMIKGIFCGLGAAVVALMRREPLPPIQPALLALLLGFVAFGLSIFLYVRAQKELGAAKTSAYYAIAPFVGVLLSILLLRETIALPFLLALGVMVAGSVLVAIDTLLVRHRHLHTHLIALPGGGETIVEHEHEHRHFVSDEKHTHPHQ